MLSKKMTEDDKVITYRVLKQVNSDNTRDHIQNNNNLDCSMDTDTAIRCYNNILTTVLDSVAPLKTKKVKSKLTAKAIMDRWGCEKRNGPTRHKERIWKRLKTKQSFEECSTKEISWAGGLQRGQKLLSWHVCQLQKQLQRGIPRYKQANRLLVRREIQPLPPGAYAEVAQNFTLSLMKRSRNYGPLQQSPCQWA